MALEDLPVALGQQLLLTGHLAGQLLGQPQDREGARVRGDLHHGHAVDVAKSGVVPSAQLVEQLAVGPQQGIVVGGSGDVGGGGGHRGGQLGGARWWVAGRDHCRPHVVAPQHVEVFGGFGGGRPVTGDGALGQRLLRDGAAAALSGGGGGGAQGLGLHLEVAQLGLDGVQLPQRRLRGGSQLGPQLLHPGRQAARLAVQLIALHGARCHC